ncbi:MAG: alkaline phosphatase family protein [Candidatus Velthaea sp.]
MFHRARAVLAGLALVSLPVGAHAAPTGFGLESLTTLPIATRTPIKHVVIIVMENRSFDNMFRGFPGADTVLAGRGHTGAVIPLAPAPYEGNCDPDHSHEAWVKDYNGGRMNGFDTTPATCVGPSIGSSAAHYPYGYLPYAEVKPYWDLASQFGVADRMFASQSGPSYPGHMYIVAGTSGNQTDDPSDPLVWGCDAKRGTTVPYLGPNGQIAGTQFPCLYQQATMGNLLDQHHIPWAYYSNNLSYTATGQEYDISTQPYDAFARIRFGPDWQNDIISKQGVAREFADIENGTLPPVAWFNPPVIASDHPQVTTNFGPDYVASVANALATSPAGYWRDTALFVTWDDPGGWYDHVAPPQLDRNGLGFRVPLIVASRFAKRHYVSHVRHEYASLLKFIEFNWNLPGLGTTDARADALLDLFDFSAANANRPASLIPGVHAGIDARYFMTSVPLDTKPLDYTPQERE